MPMRENAARAALLSVDGEIASALAAGPDGLSIPQFPIRVERDADDGGTRAGLDSANLAERILDPSQPPVAILTGEIGCGKTLFGCRLVRRLIEQHERLAVFLRGREVSLDRGPLQVIAEELELPCRGSVLPQKLGLSVLVLDGLDELVARTNEMDAAYWLRTLFDVLARSGGNPRVVVVGRIEVLGAGSGYPNLVKALDYGCTRLPPRRPQRPARYHLAQWQYKDHVVVLSEQWRARGSNPERPVQSVLPQDVVNSPLLFGYAYSLLVSDHRFADPGAQIASEWELTEDFVDMAYPRETPGPTAERRRDFTRAVSLLLCLSGRGMGGIGRDMLCGPEVARALLYLPAFRDGLGGFDSVRTWLSTHCDELARTCLISPNRQRHYAPFHQHLLTHLAAEAIEAILEDPRYPVDGRTSDLPGVLWEELAGLTARPSLARLGPVWRDLMDRRALNPGSDFQKLCRYWAKGRLALWETPGHGPLVPDLEPPLDTCSLERQIEVAGTVVMRDEILAIGRERSAVAGAWAQTPAPPIPDLDSREAWVQIEPRTVRFWAFDADGDRRLVEYRLPAGFAFMRHPVSVSLFASYLNGRGVLVGIGELPDQPEAGWRLQEGRAAFDPDWSQRAVTGLSWRDAQGFADWLGTQLLVGDAVVAMLPSLPMVYAAAEAWAADAPAGGGPGPGPLGGPRLLTRQDGDARCYLVGNGSGAGPATLPEKRTLRSGVQHQECAIVDRHPEAGLRLAVTKRSDQDALERGANALLAKLNPDATDRVLSAAGASPPASPLPPDPSDGHPQADCDAARKLKDLGLADLAGRLAALGIESPQGFLRLIASESPCTDWPGALALAERLLGPPGARRFLAELLRRLGQSVDRLLAIDHPGAQEGRP